ncbi:T9SS type A sorting domain-containing protein [Hymenobacter cellulosivorans]|uniref:T9SS type A sorting domain-containing protein n=1 Tax=Hymenobacter cellulosivorans TaxID=2932249 RepID=A0ABY4FG14_9BACT|nr:T9SS type A sorting domain-containing protein [Hymenobacter cellulosivorans]UOQ55630.1 T9SS type A sorting domain-containing protein [Hymenobacter cellulosivorans]
MTRSLRLLSSLLFGAVLLPLAAQAQVPGALPSDPSRAAAPTKAAATARPAALSLPFFDDFSTQPEGAPSPQRWEAGGGVLINNRFILAPPSRGAATFDGLNAKGLPRGSFFSDTDTLTSLPIDLSGLTAASNAYLSFFWQAGNIVSAPTTASSSRPVFIQLEFLGNGGPNDWRLIWTQRSQGQRTGFRQLLFPVTDPRFLHANFRFRFHTSGNQSNVDNDDAWSIDYVRLDRNRSATDSTNRDIATSKPLGSLLKRYTAMPVWQYNASPAPANELNDVISTTVNNLGPGPASTPVDWLGTLQVLPGGPVATTTKTGKSLDPGSRQTPVVVDARPLAIPLTPEEKVLRHSIYLLTGEAANTLTVRNDTISRLTELRNYYAYDDGTPEATLSIERFSTTGIRYRAHRYDLNKPDQVRSLRLYPILPAAAGRTITVNVWDDLNGKPAAQPKATQSFTIPAVLPAGQKFIEVNFATPVSVSGTFYVGYGHGQYGNSVVPFGLDLNNAPPDGYFLKSTFGVWENAAFDFSTVGGAPAGAVMMRPVMTNNVAVTATADAQTAATYSLYPNPSTGLVRVQGTYKQAAVLDAMGRTVWTQPVGQLGQEELNLEHLAGGIYVVQLTLPSGLLVNKRLVLAR